MFLQGPHGPFFNLLDKILINAGAKTWRVGFNAGDRVFWSRANRYSRYYDTLSDWSEAFSTLVREKPVTDIVLFDDTRPIHAHAIERANDLGVPIHVFEEGYLRPY